MTNDTEQKTKYFAEISGNDEKPWMLSHFGSLKALRFWMGQAGLEKHDDSRFILPDGRTVLIVTGRVMPPKVGV